MENWATEKEFLDLWAVHYRTGEPIPAEIVERIVAAKNFLAAYGNVRQLSFGMTDMAWHTIAEPYEGDVVAFEAGVDGSDAGTACGRPARRWPRRSAISSRAAMRRATTATNGPRCWKPTRSRCSRKKASSTAKSRARSATTYSKGGTEDPMDLYVRFRGHKPETRALIEKMGLKKEN